MNAPAEHLLPIGDGFFDPIAGTLVLGGRVSRLRPRTAALLAHLVRNAHRVVAKDELMQSVWPDVVVTEDSLVQCVKEIRRALGDDGRDWIRTIPRQGYAFTPAAAERAPTEPVPEPGWSLRLGRHSLLALVVVVVVALIAIAAVRLLPPSSDASAPPLTRSIVILPLVNRTGDALQEDFVDELTERLTNAIAHLPDATVIASGTAFTLKGKPIDARRLGTQLGVRYVLEGWIREQRPRIVLSMRLADTARAVQLWSEDFSADMGQTSILREDVVARVAGSLDLRLIRVEAQRSQRERPEDPRAADLLLRARAALRWAGQGQEGVIKGQQLLQEAVGRDPALAEGWALLAMTHLNQIRFSNSRQEDIQRAQDAVTHAMALAPDDALVQEALAKLQYNQGRMAQALASFDRAIELSPNDPVLHANRGAALSMLGRPDEGLPAIERALRLSPRDPQVPTWLMLQGATCLHLGRDAEAVALLERSVEGNPNSAFGRLFLASALGLTGRLDEAHVQVIELQRIAPGFTLTRMREREPSDAPAFREQRERVYTGLRRAGLPD